ncbi:hypothetical protein [Streptomyces sp. NBRC 110611]|uniref:hypothetical protein n=1 Tax=Streptomyces sp. NBRC 110611 TaxID=1621259 RepID=UPI0011BD4AD2|nr:hypothetical protein [Streptomyces sp. NBRC 110611]
MTATALTAEDAMAPSATAEDHIRFLTQGIHAAYEVDKQRETDRAAGPEVKAAAARVGGG